MPCFPPAFEFSDPTNRTSKRTRTTSASASGSHGFHSNSMVSKRRRDRSEEPELDVDAEPMEEDQEEHNNKRRRTVAPSLEGKSRGWNTFPLLQEEELVEEWKNDAGEYKDANTLLHELHAQNRHRTVQPVVQQDREHYLAEWEDTGGESQSVKERYEERNK